jgi:hypothetical protein
MYAIHTINQWQVIGFNKDNTQHAITEAHSFPALLGNFTKYLERAAIDPLHKEVLESFKVIKVWNVDQGFTGLELPKV